MLNGYQHKTVLLTESINALAIRKDGIYVDGTFGRGGHSMAILGSIGKYGRLIGIDRDWQAKLAADAINDDRLTFIHGEFSRVNEYIDDLNLTGKIDGFLLDLGVSSPQLDDPSRGFSFMRDGPLDMRMDTSKGMTASDWLLTNNEETIAWVIKTFGEERYARRIAHTITQQNRIAPITTTLELASLIEKSMPKKDKHKHPATRTFQAIRIYLNSELQEVEKGLENSLPILSTGGRLAVISFHSLEDRIVKQFMNKHSKGLSIPAGIPLTEKQLEQYSVKSLKMIKKIKPRSDEIEMNARARSALLRIAEKI